MVRIPNIKIPSVRVGSIYPTSNIGTGGATPAPPTPITYLTQWKIVGNSEVHGQEIWSCGEYSAVDGKYHILVQPLGGSIADIALTEPLRKVNDIADSIEFPTEQEGKAIVTRNLGSLDLGSTTPERRSTSMSGRYKFHYPAPIKITDDGSTGNYLSALYQAIAAYGTYSITARTPSRVSNALSGISQIVIYDNELYEATAAEFQAARNGIEVIYELATPTTSLVDVSPIEESTEYSMVISQGGKAVSWSSFETDSE